MKKGCKQFSVGDVLSNNEGYDFRVVDYENARNVTIQWLECGSFEVCTSGNLLKGAVKYLNKPSVFGVGFIGYGRFVPGEKRLQDGQERLNKYIHRHWRHVLERTIGGRDIKRYDDCSVTTDWYDLQTFAEWAVEQKNSTKTEENGRLYHLDKDMVCKGNRVYCPEYCVFIPNEVNAFYTKKDVGNTGFPGVNYIKPATSGAKDGYIARCTIGKEREYLGYYNSPETAFYHYKEAKEKAAKHLASLWENKIDDRVIEYLNNFVVDFNLQEV